MGDKPHMNIHEMSPDNPFEILQMQLICLILLGFNKLINLNLSIPNKISNFNNFKKKINSNPYGLITQSINSIARSKRFKKLIEYPTV